MLDMSEVFTYNGLQKLKLGQVVKFMQNGIEHNYRITTLNKKSGKVLAEEINLMTMEQFEKAIK